MEHNLMQPTIQPLMKLAQSDGGGFTRKDVKSMQGAVRRASPQLRSG
ncbi:MAG: hypothetical protein JF606_27960 [Burkholderiales bacterium]|jgi:hypothetical protein|nr:hypothetical protein [Burkholderiales bacterium]